jgi:hypothetical protein
MRYLRALRPFLLLLPTFAAACVQPSVARSSRAAAAPEPVEPVSAPAATARPDAEPTLLPASREDGKWLFGASAYTYFVPDDHTYIQPTVTLDHDRLHFEARYNYEALDTASLWVGWSFDGGDEDGLSWEITPMVGIAVGEVDGWAPGYKGTLAWWLLELYGEGEYLSDTGNGDNFFYNWSELTIAPVERFRIGIVTQRTRVYDSEHSLQRGLLIGLGLGRVEVTAHVFNPDDNKPTVVVSAAVGF